MTNKNRTIDRQATHLSLSGIRYNAVFLNVLFLLGIIVFPSIHQYQVNCDNADCNSIKCSLIRQNGSSYSNSHHEKKNHDAEHCPICHISILAKEQPNLEVGLYESGKITVIILTYQQKYVLNFNPRSCQPRAPPAQLYS